MENILNNPLSLFLITLIISFLGSVQPGMVNVMASRLVLTHGKSHSFVYCVAASIPEIFYAFIAAYFVGRVELSKQFQTIATAIAGAVLIVFGLYILFNPPKFEMQKSRFDHPMLKGLFLSITNPQLIIFWSGIILVYKEYGIQLQNDFLAISLFSLGAAVGAFLLLITYMYMTDYYLKNLNNKKIELLNKISAYVLLLIGIIATLGLFFP